MDSNLTFPNDTNLALITIQQDLFFQAASSLFFSISAKYTDAINLVGIKTDLFSALCQAQKSGLSAQPFRPLYDYLAAWYRLVKDDHGQLLLPFPEQAGYNEVLQQRWLSFLQEQCLSFTEDDEMVRLLLHTVLYPDSPDGKSAREEALIRLRENLPFIRQEPAEEQPKS